MRCCVCVFFFSNLFHCFCLFCLRKLLWMVLTFFLESCALRLCVYVKSPFSILFFFPPFVLHIAHIQFHDYWFFVFSIWSQKQIILHHTSLFFIFSIRSSFGPFFDNLFILRTINDARCTISEIGRGWFSIFSPYFIFQCDRKGRQKKTPERATGLKIASTFMGRFSFLKLKH